MLTMAGAGSQIAAAPLGEHDRTAIIEAIEALEKKEAPTLGSRRQQAMAALRQAITSEENAVDLYLRCTKTLLFDKQHRKPAEFREWKTRSRDRLKDEGFALSLKHRYMWLLLTLEAAPLDPEKRSQLLGAKAQAAMVALASDAPLLGNRIKFLQEPALQGLVAKTYGLQHLALNPEKPTGDGSEVAPKWPEASLPIGEVFQNVVLPAARVERDFVALREAWQIRLKCERAYAEGLIFGETEEDDRKDNGDFDTFVTEKQPALLWSMHVDLFRSGDEKDSAVAMLEHLKANISHPESANWIKQFKELVNESQEL